mgnify:CR=1 FL=1
MFNVLLGAAGPGVHAQARLLPPRHEAGEPAVHGPRPRQDCGLRAGPGDQVPAPLHRLRVHQVVPGSRGATQEVRLCWNKSLPNEHRVYNLRTNIDQ